jgi:hypothetical protein
MSTDEKKSVLSRKKRNNNLIHHFKNNKNKMSFSAFLRELPQGYCRILSFYFCLFSISNEKLLTEHENFVS